MTKMAGYRLVPSREVVIPRGSNPPREQIPSEWDRPSGVRVMASGEGRKAAPPPWRRWILDPDGRWRGEVEDGC